MTNKQFYDTYLVSKGNHPKSDYDRTIEVKTYIIQKDDFNYSFKNVLSSLELTFDETLEKDVHLFSRFSVSIHIGSPYDCTGQLCGYGQTVNIIQNNYEWTVLVSTQCNYDL